MQSPGTLIRLADRFAAMLNKIRISHNQALVIPERLALLIQSQATKEILEAHEAAAQGEEELDDLELEGGSSRSALDYLKKGMQSLEHDQEDCILYFGMFADFEARQAAQAGKPEDGLGPLVDALKLEHEALGMSGPPLTRRLADLLVSQTGNALQLCTLLGSTSVLFSRRDDILSILDTATTVWEPELQKVIRELKAALVASINNEQGLNQSLTEIKRDHFRKKTFAQRISKAGAAEKHSSLLLEVLDAWIEMARQEITLVSSAKYGSEGLDIQIIKLQAENLVAQMELRLRKWIALKYQQQYQTGWVQHIQAKHRPMYERWLRYRRKDTSAFQAYPDYAPDILEYSLLEDLAELIAAQWHLFREGLDFGYQERNKQVFLDKMAQIITVRNTLAHHRAPPENELLRARVLCTDVLLALDRVSEG